MFSLFVTDTEFLCCVLDIVSVFAGKLVIIVEHHLMAWLLPQCLPAMLQCLPVSWIVMVGLHQWLSRGFRGFRKQIRNWACPMSHSITDAMIKSGFRKPVQHNNLLMGCTIHSKGNTLWLLTQLQISMNNLRPLYGHINQQCEYTSMLRWNK